MVPGAPLLTPGLGDDDVLMVPLAGGPVAVADEAQEEGEEDPWALLSSWLGLDESTPAPAPASDEGPLKYFSSVQSIQSQADGNGDGVVLVRVGRGLKSALPADDEVRPHAY